MQPVGCSLSPQGPHLHTHLPVPAPRGPGQRLLTGMAGMRSSLRSFLVKLSLVLQGPLGPEQRGFHQVLAHRLPWTLNPKTYSEVPALLLLSCILAGLPGTAAQVVYHLVIRSGVQRLGSRCTTWELVRNTESGAVPQSDGIKICFHKIPR